MQTISRTTFTTVTTEGAILPADLLQRIVDGRDLDGLKPTDYHLAPNERLNEAINRSWNRLLGVWESFDERRQALPEYDRGTTLTRESWLLILLDELGFGRPTFVSSLSVDGEADEGDGEGEAARYPISHQWQHVPLHMISFRQSLDKVDDGNQRLRGGARFRRSPHSLLQEFLNRSEQHLWGVVSNGLRLRLLRDNVSFTRAAYLEFDLEAMMDGEIYADFTLLWLAAHQSRFEGDPQTCWLEQWSQEAAEQGTRALESLRDGVQNAISELGRGFLAHPANKELRAKLQSGDLDKQEYYRQLLRLVYRLIFLFVAEERNLLLEQDAGALTRERYYDHYSATHLRELAARRRSGPHADLYRSLRLVMELLREGYAPLGLPGLGSFLFSARSTPDLDGLDIANEALLKAIRALTFTVQDGVLRPVDYKNLGSEELGSVYESLLELHPEMNVGAATFNLRTAAGSERKTTGSYYTPTSLINSLLDTALEPVVADRLRGKRGREAEEALLDIRVVDPAAGSGHFLIAAANRLARHLARVRTGDEEPSPQSAREALRDVVRHCIYGVDVNEMAVELCKVSLWLETLDPGKPLNFLEANIQVGNSLIGATPALLEEGIPDEAFTAVTGDDKGYAREFKKLNREQRKGQMALFKGGQPWQRLGNLAEALQEMAALEGDTLEGVRAQEEAYAELVRSQGYQYGKLWADAWCAAFFWPLLPEEKGGFAYPITEEEFRRIEHSPFSIPRWMREEIERLADEHRFFHWHLAFPTVFTNYASRDTEGVMRDGVSRDGFDVVLGNPPWERIKLQEKEWFAGRSPQIANARNTAARRKLIKALLQTDPDLHAAFLRDKKAAENESHFARNSGRYPLSAVGDINTYQLFAGLSRQIRDEAGRVGIIVPSGIASDYYNQNFFNALVDNGELVSLFDFENRQAIFPGVHRSYKFCLLTLTGAGRPAEAAQYLFFAHSVADLQDKERLFTLSPEEIARINPNTKTAPIFRSRHDAELTKAIFLQVPSLALDEEPPVEEWGLSIRRVFNMGTSKDGNSAVLLSQVDEESRPLSRMYEAKLVHQYDHRFASYATDAESKYLTVKEKYDPRRKIVPRFYISTGEVNSRLLNGWDYGWLLSWRDICRNTDERTVIASFLPREATDFTLRIGFIGDEYRLFASLLLANLNSFVFDYCARQMLGGTHLSDYILKQLPALYPRCYTDACPWQVGSLGNWLFPRAFELTYTAYDLRPFAQDLGYEGPPFRWDTERRFLLRCELDAAYFHLYGIERDDVDYIMDTFPIVRRKDEEAYGEYRTKRVILEMYDAMAAAMETGEAYKTRLDPPPAHPDAAHPWDEEYLGAEVAREAWWDEVLLRKGVLRKGVMRKGVEPFLFENAEEAEKAEREMLSTFALRFDGYAYMKATGFEPVPAPEWLETHRELPEELLQRWAVLFALQRASKELHFAPHSPEYGAMRRLFLALYDKGFPSRFAPGPQMNDTWYERWKEQYQADVGRWAETVRRIHDQASYSDAMLTIYDEWPDLASIYRPVLRQERERGAPKVAEQREAYRVDGEAATQKELAIGDLYDFTPPDGSRSQRLKQVMALGDRAKANRQDAAAIGQLAAALGDEDQSIRWLAGSALGLLGGATVVRVLGAYLEQVDDEKGREGALNTLGRIAEDARVDEEVREMVREILAAEAGDES